LFQPEVQDPGIGRVTAVCPVPSFAAGWNDGERAGAALLPIASIRSPWPGNFLKILQGDPFPSSSFLRGGIERGVWALHIETSGIVRQISADLRWLFVALEEFSFGKLSNRARGTYAGSPVRIRNILLLFLKVSRSLKETWINNR